MRWQLLTFASALVASVLAHPERELSAREIEIRDIQARERANTAKKCDGAAAEFMTKRMERRALKKRGMNVPTPTVQAETPHYTSIQNTTCLLAPEVVEGPYYINNEIVRSNLVEDQTGVKLVIDIGVMDINTCQPIPDAFVELWASNASGIYGSYGTTFGPPGTTTPMLRNETFLRGGMPTDQNGIVELVTIYPGYYVGRTPHIHTMIHLNYETSPNGTLVSHAGSVVHMGQFFFDDRMNDQVFSRMPYSLNTLPRTYNSQDFLLWMAGMNGYNAYLQLESLGNGLNDGLLGYITVTVDSRASYTIDNKNYLNSTGRGLPEEGSAS